MPGDVLEVRILAVDLAVDYGYNTQRPYQGTLPDEFPAFWQRVIPLNREAKTAEVAPGVVVPLTRPFFGIMGVAPHPSMGRISSAPPGIHGGNMDNKDLIAGSTLYLPVHVAGALFSAGDAHGAQLTVTPISGMAIRNRPCADASSSSSAKSMSLTWPAVVRPNLHPGW